MHEAFVEEFPGRFRGEVFKRNLYPASRTYRKTVHLRHYNEMKAASCSNKVD
jgi:hypothetical protein